MRLGRVGGAGRRRRRRTRRGADLKGTTATALLRPALETAVVVAREGERATPAVPAPPQLRRYLNFARLPDPALEVARRVLDDDAEFRGRVAAATSEEVVGRAGWLFLIRPDGWLEELDELLQQAAAAELAAKAERHERGAQRRLAGAEAALARAEATAQAAAADLAAVRAELAGEREAHRATEARLERAEAEIDRLQRERADLIRRLKSTEASAVERAAELRATRHELRMVQAELAQVGEGGPRAGDDGDKGDGDGGAAPRDDVVDRAHALALLDEAREAIGRLDAAFERFVDRAGLRSHPPPAPSGAAGGAVAPEGPAAAAPRRRRPVPLPPATFDDAPEAAEHLVRVPGALVLVDGYNISNARWHGRPPAEQRERLLAACAELHARLGTEVEVVFDGAGDQPAGSGPVHQAGVRHRFTPADTEADDVILALVDAEPPTRPVIVVSSDRRVRDGAHQRGANVLGAKQFLHVVRR